MKHSSYHNRLQSWIKNGYLVDFEITTKKVHPNYDEKTRTYKGAKENQEVLVLYFNFNKSFFIRSPLIQEYIDFIKKCEKY